MLKISDLSKQLNDFSLAGITFDVKQGEYFVLLGESGAGKTVILELIAGLLAPDAGTVVLNGENITGKRIQDRGISLVYQDHALFPHMSVRQNIAYGLRDNTTTPEVLAEMVGASDLLDRAPGTLSLGEAQRVALARALAAGPQLLLLDEPLASLDTRAKTEIRRLLRGLNNQGQTIVHVTHDYQEALALANRVAVVENCMITQVGSPDEVFHYPKSAFVASFAGNKNFFHGTLVKNSDGTGIFTTAGAEFVVTAAAETPDGAGFIIFESTDVTVAAEPFQSSARNRFKGEVVDIEPVRLGMEVAIDIGVQVWAAVTAGSAMKMGLEPGRSVWVSFKSTAVRYISE
jgi:molybdopterin-binding protein